MSILIFNFTVIADIIIVIITIVLLLLIIIIIYYHCYQDIFLTNLLYTIYEIIYEMQYVTFR